MEWQYGETKELSHGISFEEAIAVFDDPDILTIEDARNDVLRTYVRHQS
jgi:uncharacterized DUF497 family protein